MPKLQFKFIWNKLSTIDLFKYIFENKELNKNTILYSCFKYPNDKYNVKLDNEINNIYYTGERFLDDLNSNITIGFLPSNIIYNNDKKIYEYINPRDLINENYRIQIINVNRGYKNKELLTILFPTITKPNKIYLQIRDQEREHIEYLIKHNTLNNHIPLYIFNNHNNDNSNSNNHNNDNSNNNINDNSNNNRNRNINSNNNY